MEVTGAITREEEGRVEERGRVCKGEEVGYCGSFLCFSFERAVVRGKRRSGEDWRTGNEGEEREEEGERGRGREGCKGWDVVPGRGRERERGRDEGKVRFESFPLIPLRLGGFEGIREEGGWPGQ